MCMRAHSCHSSSDRKRLDYEVLRPFRVRAELAAMRAESLRYLAGQIGRVERLLQESPTDSLTADELLTLSNLVTKLKQLALP
jgi:hypothetical protein